MAKKKKKQGKLTKPAKSEKEATMKSKSSNFDMGGILQDPFSETKQSVGKSLSLLASALTLVAGLAWNDAIKELMANYIQPALDSVLSQTLGDLAVILTPFIYALVVTVGVVFLVNRIEKIEDKFAEDKEEADK